LANGWIVFIDRNGNLQREVEDEQLVRAHGAIHESLSLRVIDRANWFSFDRSGLGRGVAADMPMFSAALFCDKRGNAEESGGLSAARYLAVTPIGRAVLVRDARTIEAAGGC
jgi:hypothetical protein